MTVAITPESVCTLLDGFVPRGLHAAVQFGDDFPDCYDVAAGQWQMNGSGTEGFWPGLLWWLHAYSHDGRLARQAARTTRLVARLKADVDDHDLGLLFYPSCVLEFLVSGNEEMVPAALAAANRLAGRFVSRGRFLSAHGPLDGPRAGFALIDTVMNLRLLFWAARHASQPRWEEIARETAATIARVHVRPNGSSCHAVWFDVTTGQVVKRDAVMATSVDSCWARGQAWGIHGFAQVHQLTGESSFKDTAARMADYFLSRVPADGVIFHDLDDPAAPAVPRDTSAQAIAAGGLLTLAECSQGEERARWLAGVERLLGPLLEGYLPHVLPADMPPRGFLSHGCKSLKNNEGLVSELVLGDYYLVETLVRWLAVRAEL